MPAADPGSNSSLDGLSSRWSDPFAKTTVSKPSPLTSPTGWRKVSCDVVVCVQLASSDGPVGGPKKAGPLGDRLDYAHVVVAVAVKPRRWSDSNRAPSPLSTMHESTIAPATSYTYRSVH